MKINKKISIVIPSYNEEKYIFPLYERLTSVLKKITNRYEIIYVNNGSTDNSEKFFYKLANKDKNVKIIFLSRNFGSQGAHSAGISIASGDAIVCMDGDLQDPPEVIPRFVEKWLNGYDVVYGIREKRKGNILKNIAYKLFYRILKRFSYVNIPLDAGDFALFDKKVSSILKIMPEKDRFIRGMRAYSGFKQIGIPYVREDRLLDKPKYNLFDNFNMASRWFFSFSYFPLEIISFLAFLIAFFSFGAIVYYIFRFFAFHDSPAGWSTLITIVLFLGAIQLIALSIIGKYVGRIFEEVKQRPAFIIDFILQGNKNGKKKTQK